MATLTDLYFKDGDLMPIEVSPGVWDLSIVEDNVAVIQTAALNLNLQKAFNQYSPEAGWDLFKYLGANLSQTDVDEICRQVRVLMENVDFVISAKVAYIGVDPVGSQSLHTFQVSAVTLFGTAQIPFAVGGPS